MIKIIGPRDKRDPTAINTTSHSPNDWASGLSPFRLGPCQLYGQKTARIFENAWQFSKLYPEHADQTGEPTTAYWNWAQDGWHSTRAHRYPLGKGRKPLCSLWDGQRLDYITARKQIYLPLYQRAVGNTRAYEILERTYRQQGSITLFDFDGYDHTRLNMNLRNVLECPDRICGHAFILSMMVKYGRDFKPEDLPATDDDPVTKTHSSETENQMYPITVVNKKTFRGQSEYIGRAMPGIRSSPLRNNYKVKPHGPYERGESVEKYYRRWLWEKMQQNQSSPEYVELIRLAELARNRPLNLACWCDPEKCHGDVIKSAIAYIVSREGAARKTDL